MSGYGNNLSNIPVGAEFDSCAPWNQPDAPNEYCAVKTCQDPLDIVDELPNGDYFYNTEGERICRACALEGEDA